MVCTLIWLLTIWLMCYARELSANDGQLKSNRLVKLTFGDVGPRSSHAFHASLRYVVYSSKNFIIHKCSAVIISERFLITIGRCLSDHLRWKNQSNVILKFVAIIGEEQHHLTYLPEHLAYEFTYTRPTRPVTNKTGNVWSQIFPLRLDEHLQFTDKIQPIEMANKEQTERYTVDRSVLIAFSIGIIRNDKTHALMGSKVQRTRVIVDKMIPCEEGYICTRSTTVIKHLISEDWGSALVVRRKNKQPLLIGLMESGNIIFGDSKWMLVHPHAQNLMNISIQCA